MAVQAIEPALSQPCVPPWTPAVLTMPGKHGYEPPLQTGDWSSLPGSGESEFQLGVTCLSHLCSRRATCSGPLLGILPPRGQSKRSPQKQDTPPGWLTVANLGRYGSPRPAPRGKLARRETQSLRTTNARGNQFAESPSLTCAAGKVYMSNSGLPASRLRTAVSLRQAAVEPRWSGSGASE